VTAIVGISTDREQDLDLFAVVPLLWSYKYLIGTIMCVAVLAAAAYAFIVTPTYRAEVGVTEVADKGASALSSVASQLGGLAGAAGISLGSSGASRQANAVLQSRRLVEEFIERNSLIPILFPNSKKPQTLWYAVRKFQRNLLDIKEDTRKGVTTVSIEWNNPDISAKWANGFVALANDMVRGRVLAESNRNVAYLNEQLKHTNDVQLQRVIYDLIESETKTLMIAYERPEFAFTVVDPAVAPEVRTSPRRVIILALAAVLGFLIGAGVALSHYVWSRRRLNIERETPVERSI
jgi:uncharacterized protein involved in exopolysaccharide biosynthesis